MSGSSPPKRLTLELSQGDAAIVAAALRQYQPYLSPANPDAEWQLTELAQDIADLLARLRVVEPNRSQGLLDAFRRAESTLRLVRTTTTEHEEGST